MNGTRKALLRALMSRSNGFSPRSPQKSLDGLRDVAVSEEKVDKTAWERSGATGHAMSLLGFQFLSHLCRTMSRHSTFQSGGANGTTGRRSARRALDKRDLIVPVPREAQKKACSLMGRAARLGGSD